MKTTNYDESQTMNELEQLLVFKSEYEKQELIDELKILKMKLISDKEIEEAARVHSNEYWGENYITECKNYNEAGFNAGVDFALKEVEQLIVEFNDFCSSIERNSLTGLYWFNLKHLTTQQLLQQFIEQRNK